MSKIRSLSWFPWRGVKARFASATPDRRLKWLKSARFSVQLFQNLGSNTFECLRHFQHIQVYGLTAGACERISSTHVVPSPPCAFATKVACPEQTVAGVEVKSPTAKLASAVQHCMQRIQKGYIRPSVTLSPFLSPVPTLRVVHLSFTVARGRSAHPKSVYEAALIQSRSTNKQRQTKLKKSKNAPARGFPPPSPACPRIPRRCSLGFLHSTSYRQLAHLR